jgi:hypothetical protein
VVSPDDYDAAACHSPAACPLFAMGDARTGRQLLRDAHADAAAPAAALPPARVRAVVGRLAVRAATLCQALAGRMESGPGLGLRGLGEPGDGNSDVESTRPGRGDAEAGRGAVPQAAAKLELAASAPQPGNCFQLVDSDPPLSAAGGGAAVVLAETAAAATAAAAAGGSSSDPGSGLDSELPRPQGPSPPGGGDGDPSHYQSHHPSQHPSPPGCQRPPTVDRRLGQRDPDSDHSETSSGPRPAHVPDPPNGSADPNAPAEAAAGRENPDCLSESHSGLPNVPPEAVADPAASESAAATAEPAPPPPRLLPAASDPAGPAAAAAAAAAAARARDNALIDQLVLQYQRIGSV